MALPDQNPGRQPNLSLLRHPMRTVEILGRELRWDDVYRECKTISVPANRNACRFFKQVDRYTLSAFEAKASDTKLTLYPINGPLDIGFEAEVKHLPDIPEGLVISFAAYLENPEYAQRYGEKRYTGMPKGYQLTRSALDFFQSLGYNIVAEHSEWRPGSRNHREFTEAIKRGCSPEEAARMTRDGQNALELGFSDNERIRVTQATNHDRTTTYFVDFFKPSLFPLPSRRDNRETI